MFYIGCPMWGYKEWVGSFFPPHTPSSDFLHIYSRQLTTVEGNTTFYAIPSAETIERWCAETPPEFRFCFKIPRDISHAPHIETRKSEILYFTDRIRRLKERVGPLFLQLSPSFGPTQLPQLQAFLDYWPADLRLAVEVRNPDFYKLSHTHKLNELLAQYKVARVMMDTRPIRIGSAEEKQILQSRERKPDLPVQIAATTDFIFLRYIGHPRMEANNAFLDAWAWQLAQWIEQGLNPYVFCHCPFEVHSPSICSVLYEKVKTLTPLVPLPWQPDQTENRAEQARLF
jgi:uncharacterized protein YecE (DUF72 family)